MKNSEMQESLILEQFGQIDLLDDSEKIRKRPSKTVRKKMKHIKKLEYFKNKKEEKKLEIIERKEESERLKEEIDSKQQPEVMEEVEVNSKKKKKKKIKRLERANLYEKLRMIHENNIFNDNTLRISIDCSFSLFMSEKEQTRLAQQIGRCYASNRISESPAQITIANVNEESFFYKEMCRVNYGFEKYVIIKTEKSIEEHYSNDLHNLCYLSPDAETALEELDLNKVYIIGGLVDETVIKRVTLSKSRNLNLMCVRLPINEYMKKRCSGEDGDKKYNFSKILALNQVLDILLNFNLTKDWKSALSISVPQRKGFLVEENK